MITFTTNKMNLWSSLVAEWRRCCETGQEADANQTVIILSQTTSKSKTCRCFRHILIAIVFPLFPKALRPP